MKSIAFLLAGAVLFGVPTALHSQTAGSVANVTVNMTLHFTSPGTTAKNEMGKPINPAEPAFGNTWIIDYPARNTTEETTEFVSKTTAFKYGNKEFIYDLVYFGLLPQIGSAPYIAGWSIVQVTPTLLGENGTSPGYGKFFAVRKNPDHIVDLSNVLWEPDLSSAGIGSGIHVVRNFKSVVKTNYADPENVIASGTVADSYTLRFTRYFRLDLDPDAGIQFGFGGIYSFTGRLMTVTIGADKVPVHLMGAQKLSSIWGEGPMNPVTSEAGLMEGSISIAPGKADTDLVEYE